MTVLVTGATGFIGRRVVARLCARGDREVIAVARRRPADALPCRVVAADLLEPGAAAALVRDLRPTQLLHLAWEARPGLFWTAPANLDWCARSLDLLAAFAGAGGTRAVLAGSVAEYRWDRPVLSEADAGDPATLYGVAKDALRRLALRWAEAADLSLAWGRVFWLYGPGEPPGRLVSDLLARFLAGQEAATSSGTQERDFLHVDDVAGAFVAALDSAHRGAFNIGSGVPVAVRTVAETLADMAGTPYLLRVGARPDTPGEPPRLVADTAVLNDAIGYRPEIGLRDGLTALVADARRRTAG